MSAVLTTDDHMAKMTPLAQKTGAKVLCMADSSQDSREAQARIPCPPSCLVYCQPMESTAWSHYLAQV